MTNFLSAHWGLITALGAYVFLAVVASLPTPGDPRPVSQKLYETFYDTLHLLANRVVVKYPPPGEPKV